MRDYWARVIPELSGIPAIFRKLFSETCQVSEDFPYTVFAPADWWGGRRVNPKLLWIYGDRLFFLEAKWRELIRLCIPLAEATGVEMGRLLLHSWIKIEGIADGAPKEIMLEYNTVVSPVIQPIAEAIRTAAAGIAAGASLDSLHSEHEKFIYLGKINYKYMNFAKASLLPGEKVLCHVYEPDIYGKKSFFGTTCCPVHLVILTDRELIVIRDGHGRKRKEDMRYGGIWSYTPLGKIGGLALTHKNEELLLTACLTSGSCLSTMFDAAQADRLRQLIKTHDALHAYTHTA